MTYTTQELIQILDQELKANWRGERIVLSSAERIQNPVVAKALNLDRVSKVFAYQDFRREIHQYQRDNQVSGLIWQESTFQGVSLRSPQLYNQLIAIPGDKAILIAAKKSVLSFWSQITSGLNIWLAGPPHRQITMDSLQELIAATEWAEVEAARTEVYLGLCWGNPNHCQYQWAAPESGCYRIIATPTEPGQIKF